MALAKALHSIPLAAGIDTENNPVLVDNSRFIELQNVVFDKGLLGQLHKRNGYTALPSTLSPSGTWVTGASLHAFNQEIGIVTAPTLGAPCELLTLPEALNEWQRRGQIPHWVPTETPIYSGSTSPGSFDTCSSNGVSYYAFELNGQVLLRVVDEETKSVYFSGIRLIGGTNNYNPKCLAYTISGTAYVTVFYSDTAGNLYAATLDPTNPQTGATVVTTAIGTPFPLQVTAVTNETMYDVVLSGSNIAVVGINTSGSGELVCWTLAPVTFATVSYAVIDFNVAVDAGAVCTCPAGTTPGTVIFVAQTVAASLPVTSQHVNWYFYDTSSNVIGNHNQTAGTYPVPRLTACAIAVNRVSMVFENAPLVTAPAGTLPSIETLSIFVNGTLTSGTLIYGVSLCGQPLTYGDGKTYFLAQNISSVQPTLFLLAFTTGVTSGAYVAGRYLSQSAGGMPQGPALAPPAAYLSPLVALFSLTNRMPAFSLVGTAYQTAVSAVVEAVSVNDKLTTVTGIAELLLTPGTGYMKSVQLGQNLHIAAGSLLWNYDGTTLAEHGFNLFPEAPTLTRQDSWLSVVYDNLDPTLATAQTLRICVPDNITTPGGPVGQLITPGEYITFYASGASGSTPMVLYFKVNSVGSAPSGSAWSGWTTEAINVTSQMTAIQVATAISAALTAHVVNYTVAYTPVPQTSVPFPQTITLTASITANARSLPALSRQFTCTQVAVGTSPVAQVCITGTPASLIENGQYCLFTTGGLSGADNALQPYYVYFTINQGTPANFDPGIAGALGINVNLIGTEDAAGVAAAVANALFAFGFTGTLNPGVAVSGNTVTILRSSSSSVVEAAANYAVNPYNGGVQQNYVGFNQFNLNNSFVAVAWEAVYEWIDAQGQLHQSAPSVPAVLNIPVYTSASTYGPTTQPNASIQVGITPLGLTQKSRVDIAIYRTTSNGQIYYRVTSPTNVLFNIPTSSALITYLDENSETEIQSNQPIYTTGNILENNCPPPCSIIINHQGRLVVADAEDQALMYFSQPFSPALGVSFNAADLTLRINPSVGSVQGGAISQLGSMDGNLIVLQQNLLQFIAGTGPDNAGLSSGQFEGFAPAQLVASSTAIGCRDPGSVVLTPGGLFFKSTQGFYMLARGLALQYVGAAVKGFNADVVVAATALDTNTQVRFLSQTGTTLVFDWFYNAWGSFTAHQGYDSISFKNTYYYLNVASGFVFEEAPGVYSDNGTGFAMTVVTAWLKVANLQGFQRVWKIFLQGFFSNTFVYQVQIAYDYNPTVVDTFTKTATSDRRQFKVYPSSELSEALQLTFSDQSPYNLSVTPALNALDLEYGTRKGGYKRLGPGGSIG